MSLLFNAKLSQYDEGVLTAHTAETCRSFNGAWYRCIPVVNSYVLFIECLYER